MTEYRSKTITPPETIEAIRKMWVAGERRTTIAVKLGVGVKTVWKYTRDMPRKQGRRKD